MANELQYYGNTQGESGLTVIVKLYNNVGAQLGADISTAEVGALAIYNGDMPSADAGSYVARFFSGAKLLGHGEINWDGSAEITSSIINDKVAAIPTTDNVADLTPVLTAISNLNDFNPASESVTASNMRGTDNASTHSEFAVVTQMQAVADDFKGDSGAETGSAININLTSFNVPDAIYQVDFDVNATGEFIQRKNVLITSGLASEIIAVAAGVSVKYQLAHPTYIAGNVSTTV